MNNLYDLLKTMRDQHNVSWEILEQDYVLSWMLAGIAQTSDLRNMLVFKGGTALKKCYFGNYRFSQDLDFTLMGALPSDSKLENLMISACSQAMALQQANGNPIQIQCKQFHLKAPHPFNQKAFIIMAQFPWHRDFHTRIMVDITTQEILILPAINKTIIHQYHDEVIEGTLLVYTLEEIIAEKIRAITQYTVKFHERGWGRSRARDYYDLWRILKQYENGIDKTLLPQMVLKKCSIKDIIFSHPAELFTLTLMEDLEDAWKKWLDPFVPDLPNHVLVLRELRELLDTIWAQGNSLQIIDKAQQESNR